MIDWNLCSDVEKIPGKVSGRWLVKGTRIPVDDVLVNAEDGFSAEEIASEIYEGLPVERAKRVIAFAKEAHGSRVGPSLRTVSYWLRRSRKAST